VGCPVAILLTTRLHVLQSDEGTFTETAEAGTYLLELTGTDNEVTWFTDRPWHDTGSESLDTFIGDTWLSVLAGEQPTGAVAYQDVEGYWNMAPIKAVALDADTQAGDVTWGMRMKGVPPLDTLRDVHVYLDDRTASEDAEGDSFVFLHGAANIALEPQDEENVFTLRLSYPYPSVTVMGTGADFTVYVETIDAYIEKVWAGDFVENPPNAAVQIEGPDGAAHVIVVVLSEPAYDPATDEMTYRAKLLRGDPGISAGPGVLFIDDWSDEDDNTIYTVVMNHEEMYSIWPADREIPLGWNAVGKTGTKQECLDYIEEVWTDMRPLSLRKKMEEMGMATSSAITQATIGSATVLYLRGKITIGVGDVRLREAVHAVLDSGVHNIVLDLGGVTVIDSSGVGELVSSYTTVTNRGGRLALSSLPSNVLDILTITQLITVFDVYDTAEEAAASFGK
ncbi:MAG: anti-sigma factor antagonist, partial [Candidatus Hydrogenedentes bacterium]|nr:anti-sigma factor antagonist [Candidatus Hydrogenedentota bacterium]